MIKRFKNTLGEFISGFCKLLDGLVLICTLGTVNLRTSIKWSVIRVQYALLIDMNIEQSEFNA